MYNFHSSFIFVCQTKSLILLTNPSSVHCTAAVVSSVKCKYDKIGDNYSATRVSAGAGAAADGMNITPAARCPLIVSMLESSTGGSHGASD